MSTKLHDIANAGLLVRTCSLAAASTNNTGGTVTTPTSGLAYGDFVKGDGRCFALLSLGAPSGAGGTFDCKVQESTDGSAWTDVTGAAFSQATTGSGFQSITFDRTKRYLRSYNTIQGATTWPVSVVIGQQLKVL